MDEAVSDTSYIPQFSEDSYLRYSSLPKPISSVTDISLRLKPLTYANQLLFYSGSTGSPRNGDFIALQLVSAYVLLVLDLGGGAITVRSELPLILNEWSDITVKRKRTDIVLTVDDQLPKSATSPGSYVELNTDGMIYLGGHADIEQVARKVNASSSFQGCIMQAIVNGLLLLTREATDGINIWSCQHRCQQKGICSEGSRCIPDRETFSCACPLHRSGERCDIQGQKSVTNKGDYLLVAIDDAGNLYVEFDLGGGAVNETYPKVINDGEYHIIRTNRNKDFASLKVGYHDYLIFRDLPKGYTTLNADSDLYIGGYPPGKGVATYKHLVGCISYLEIGDFEVDPVAAAIGGENIQKCPTEL
ncbi:pikachurin-like [Watersipora subatra]|uniref:pikachurin-like n=1 Tax=Watersipora subatra TaxID=2589382 RepID=UPI00355B00B1